MPKILLTKWLPHPVNLYPFLIWEEKPAKNKITQREDSCHWDVKSEPSVCQWGSRGRRSPPARPPSGPRRRQTLLFVPSVYPPELRFFICVFILETQLLPLRAALVLATFLPGHRNCSFLPSSLWSYSFQMASLGPLFSLSYKMPSQLPSASLIGIVAWIS